eukprot:TRINITY_DN16349_c0_g1_i1.p1 TRINITY_DN16349_c0_g1~~TRINITY_DN16349_c0_g1_i1.p1  ORF type:complete len:107 (+),score=48.80 TRINITY_DN16349_c0_g1_i1:54-374(+)
MPPRFRPNKAHQRFFNPLRIFQMTMFMTLPFMLIKFFNTSNADTIVRVGDLLFPSPRNELLEQQFEDGRRQRAANPVPKDDRFDYFRLMDEFKKQRSVDLQESKPL